MKILYDINSCLVGSDTERKYTHDYMRPFMEGPSQQMISNLDTQSALLDTDDILLPVTINNEEYDNTYVCSPYTACVSYAKEELVKLKNKPLEITLGFISTMMGWLLKKASINKIVSVNNWMLSTNLYAAWDGSNISAIRKFLVAEFPNHALMFRSLNWHSSAALMKEFKKDGFVFVPSRQVYIFDDELFPWMQLKHSKRDARTLLKTKYKIINHTDITEADYPRIVELYNLLYLEKYSYHNPQFTLQCISYWHKTGLLQMQGLRNASGILDGVIGYFEKNGITTAPLVGYDTNKPKNLALYRILIALALQRAKNNKLVLNLSSGASGFKILRGGQAFIEYSAIYIRHLPWSRKVIWHLMNTLLTYIGIPIMNTFKL